MLLRKRNKKNNVFKLNLLGYTRFLDRRLFSNNVAALTATADNVV